MRIPSIGAAVFGGGSKLVAISLAMRGAGAFLTLRPVAAFFSVGTLAVRTVLLFVNS